MRKTYLLDTSFLINGWAKRYRRDVFPCIWSRIEDLMRDSTVVSCDEVLHELKPKGDDLYEWARLNRQSFLKPDTRVIAEITTIMAQFANFAASSSSTRNAADPWVIAHAKVIDAVVVTDESPNRPKPLKATKPPKIPDVCDDLSVAWMTPIDFLRAISVCP